MFRQGTLNAAKNGHPCKVLGNTDNDSSSSSSGSSREDSNAVVDKSNSSVCMSDGKKSSEEEEVELWVDLFGEHFRDDRLPPLVEISLPQLLHLIAPVKR